MIELLLLFRINLKKVQKIYLFIRKLLYISNIFKICNKIIYQKRSINFTLGFQYINYIIGCYRCNLQC